jgi:hypothetical protein
MLVLARVLADRPRLLLVNELSFGLTALPALLAFARIG